MCERLASAQRRADDEETARLAAQEQLRHADRLTTVGKLASGDRPRARARRSTWWRAARR